MLMEDQVQNSSLLTSCTAGANQVDGYSICIDIYICSVLIATGIKGRDVTEKINTALTK